MTTRLADLLERIETGKSFGSAARPARPDEWGIVKVSSMTWGQFRPDENKLMSDPSRAEPRHEIRPGDVLVSRANTTEYVGAPVLVRHTRPRLLLSDKSLRLVPKCGVDAAYLTTILSAPQTRRRISELATGTKDSMRNISQAALLTVEMPTLPPIEEQRRIVDMLEGHLSCLNGAEDLIRKSLKRLDALQERTVQGALTAGGPKGVPASRSIPDAGVDDGQLVDLPEGWSWRRLGEIAEVVGGVTKDAKKQIDPRYVEVPYLRVANVQRGRLDLTMVTTIRVPPEKARALELRRGDVLLNEGGDRDKLGRGWVWDDEIPDCIHQNHVFRARVHDGALEPKLLSWAANTIGGPWCERNGKQSVNLASISLSRIRLMPIPVPPPEVQSSVVASIEKTIGAANRVRSACEAALGRSAALRRALLMAAFSGRLTGSEPVLDLAVEAIV